jgi:hypothetical protein
LRKRALGHELSRPISLFGLKPSAGGAPIIARRAERRIKMAVAQLRLLRIERALSVTEDSPSRDEIPELAHIFLLRADSFGRQKAAPASGEKLGPRRRSDTDRLNTTDECCMLCVRVSFDTTTCFTTTRTPCGRTLFPVFGDHLKRIDRSCAVAISRFRSSPRFLIRRKVGSSAAPSRRAESHRNKTIARPVS